MPASYCSQGDEGKREESFKLGQDAVAKLCLEEPFLHCPLHLALQRSGTEQWSLEVMITVLLGSSLQTPATWEPFTRPPVNGSSFRPSGHMKILSIFPASQSNFSFHLLTLHSRSKVHSNLLISQMPFPNKAGLFLKAGCWENSEIEESSLGVTLKP